jgi:hypothetical protein
MTSGMDRIQGVVMILRRSVSRLGALMLLSGVILCSSDSPAQADLPRPPKPTPDSNEPQLQMSTSSDGKAHVRIPRSMLNSLANPTTPARSDSGISPAHTVVAGIALSAALAVGGLLFARRRSGHGPALLLIAGIGGVGLLSTIAAADVSPFGHGPRPPRPTPTQSTITTPVVVEVIDDGPLQLTIPASKAELLAQHPTTNPSSSVEK